MDRDHSRDRIAPHLDGNERVLWRQAAPPLRLVATKIPGLIFALVWAGFSWGWTAIVTSGMWPALWSGDFRGALIAMPFMFLGVGLLFSSIGIAIVWGTLADLAASWGTQYALTNERVIIVTGDVATSYGADAFTQIERRGATISFAWGPMGRRGSGFAGALIGVDDPARVEHMIRSTFREQAGAR